MTNGIDHHGGGGASNPKKPNQPSAEKPDKKVEAKEQPKPQAK